MCIMPMCICAYVNIHVGVRGKPESWVSSSNMLILGI